MTAAGRPVQQPARPAAEISDRLALTGIQLRRMPDRPYQADSAPHGGLPREGRGCQEDAVRRHEPDPGKAPGQLCRTVHPHQTPFPYGLRHRRWIVHPHPYPGSGNPAGQAGQRRQLKAPFPRRQDVEHAHRRVGLPHQTAKEPGERSRARHGPRIVPTHRAHHPLPRIVAMARARRSDRLRAASALIPCPAPIGAQLAPAHRSATTARRTSCSDSSGTSATEALQQDEAPPRSSPSPALCVTACPCRSAPAAAMTGTLTRHRRRARPVACRCTAPQ